MPLCYPIEDPNSSDHWEKIDVPETQEYEINGSFEIQHSVSANAPYQLNGEILASFRLIAKKQPVIVIAAGENMEDLLDDWQFLTRRRFFACFLYKLANLDSVVEKLLAITSLQQVEGKRFLESDGHYLSSDAKGHVYITNDIEERTYWNIVVKSEKNKICLLGHHDKYLSTSKLRNGKLTVDKSCPGKFQMWELESADERFLCIKSRRLKKYISANGSELKLSTNYENLSESEYFEKSINPEFGGYNFQSVQTGEYLSCNPNGNFFSRSCDVPGLWETWTMMYKVYVSSNTEKYLCGEKSKKKINANRKKLGRMYCYFCDVISILY
eukprot:TRINITY_DN2279_c0_g1_i1.p1 TRINITY_DN2279_c0_g1~~TRINITY_DN2279_c0_g1_i1.p1  ORF type:complete len:334 (-),score=51.84 TRINITY_DN2279_c0_g1_i1:225-1205(-)